MLSRRLTSLHSLQGSILRRQCFSSESSPLLVEKLTGTDSGIVVFSFNRPATRNAISKLMLSRLLEEADAIRTDKNARVLILRSNVPGAFCSGADLKERKGMPQSEVGVLVSRLRGFADQLASLPMPTIAAIDGFALGGGLEFALACDMRVASAKAKLGLTETRLAIIPGAGGCQRLPLLVGASRAKEMIFTGRILNGAEAEHIGLVNHVTTDDASDAAYNKSLEIAREIINRGPVAVRLAKVAIDTAVRADAQVANKMEEQCYAQIVVTTDRVEGLAAFNEKRPPVYKGE